MPVPLGVSYRYIGGVKSTELTLYQEEVDGREQFYARVNGQRVRPDQELHDKASAKGWFEGLVELYLEANVS